MACFFPFGEQQLNAMQCSELHNEQGMRREKIEGEEKEREREERERGRDEMEGRGRKRGKGNERRLKWREKGVKGGLKGVGLESCGAVKCDSMVFIFLASSLCS